MQKAYTAVPPGHILYGDLLNGYVLTARVVRYRTLEEEAEAERAKRGVMRQALAGEDTSVNASLYILLRAVDRFEATCGRFPGTLDGCATPYTATWPSTELPLHTSETAGQHSCGSSVHPYMAALLPFRELAAPAEARSATAQR